MMQTGKTFEEKRRDIETWLQQMEAKLERLAPVAQTLDVIEMQLKEQKSLQAETGQWRSPIDSFIRLVQKMVSEHPSEDSNRAWIQTEKINQRYSTLCVNIQSRNKALYNALNSLQQLDKALDRFLAWLSESESNVEMLESESEKLTPEDDVQQTSGWQEQLMELQREIESQRDLHMTLNERSGQLLENLDNQDDAMLLCRKMEEVNHRWHGLRLKVGLLKNRLESNSEQWNQLLLSLRELSEWVIKKEAELSVVPTTSGEISMLQRQKEEHRTFCQQLEDKKPIIESNVLSAQHFIAKEPTLLDASDSEAKDYGPTNGYSNAEDQAREVISSIKREVKKLSDKWNNLVSRAENRQKELENSSSNMVTLQKLMEDVNSHLLAAENIRSKWTPVPDFILEQLPEQLNELRIFKDKIAPLQRHIDSVNDAAAQIASCHVLLSHSNLNKLEEINTRWRLLELAIDERGKQLESLLLDQGSAQQQFLSASVESPWERSVSAKKVPYYINHSTATTHWDHPKMIELMDAIAELNNVRYSAYRTSLKLRMVQKRLCLDLINHNNVENIFDNQGLRGHNDKLISVPEMITCLSALYEVAASEQLAPVFNIPLCVDLCLNWLLNLYDTGVRTGYIRILSFKVGISLLCKGPLDDKFRYLFRLIADLDKCVNERKLALLLHDCVQIPRLLGEIAAFGGSNIEPSVRSCFEKAGNTKDITINHFINWLQLEPQSLVWLPVLQRISISESAKHQAKCNICKAYPIVGLRYRCLKCFNTDLCQNCFFTGRTAKTHKATHPMKEYCNTTTSGEDVKDFTRIVANKFKSKRHFTKHPKLGYLPVQTVLEGDDLESPAPSPHHTLSSQEMHSRLELYATRLAEVELKNKSNSESSEDEHTLIAQYCQTLNGELSLPIPHSPAHIMALIDAEQREELESMIHELEEENRHLQQEYENLKDGRKLSMSAIDDNGGHFIMQSRDEEMLAEAKLLRQHKGQLEARMQILEDHNRQLEIQLQRLRQLLQEPNPPGTGSLPKHAGIYMSPPASVSVGRSLPSDPNVRRNGHLLDHSSGDEKEVVSSLFEMADSVGKAVGKLMTVLTDDEDGCTSDNES